MAFLNALDKRAYPSILRINGVGVKAKIKGIAMTTATTSNLPLPIQSAINKIQDFVERLKYSREACIRAMRPERKECLVRLLTAMLRSCSLQHSGAICALNGVWVRPKTVQELAEQAEISFAQATRALADLRKLGYVESKQIKRKSGATGQLEVSPGLRCFTMKFWQELGLLDLWQKSVVWAKKHCQRKFLLPFKQVTTKIKTTFVAASKIVKSALGQISGEQANRVKRNCDRIRAMLSRK